MKNIIKALLGNFFIFLLLYTVIFVPLLNCPDPDVFTPISPERGLCWNVFNISDFINLLGLSFLFSTFFALVLSLFLSLASFISKTNYSLLKIPIYFLVPLLFISIIFTFLIANIPIFEVIGSKLDFMYYDEIFWIIFGSFFNIIFIELYYKVPWKKVFRNDTVI